MNSYRRKIEEHEYRRIANRVALNGEMASTLAKEYNVSRERIRQIVKSIHKGYSSRQSKDSLIAPMVDEIIERRHWFEGPGHIFEHLDFTRINFDSYLKRRDPDALERWKMAMKRPWSKVADKEGRDCVTCRVYKPWDQYYNSNGPNTIRTPNNKSVRCSECTKTSVNRYTNLRDVQTPTVAEKRCPKCGETKLAGEFHRATKQVSGLQTYCILCMKEAPSTKGAI